MAEKKNIYPHLVIKNNENPNKLYAFPLLGLLIKIVMLLPVLIVYWALSVAYVILWLITPFVILFTGKYWETSYKLNIALLTYRTKITLFVYGLTDQYPGFTLGDDGIFELHIDKPSSPNRFLALPFFGIFIRLILLIPFLIFQSVLQYGVQAAMLISWFAVLFRGKFPESLYEFERDTTRVALASTAYMTYLSDTYPSFYISMKHKTTKVLLIIAGSLLLLMDVSNRNSEKNNSESYEEIMMQQYEAPPEY